MIYATYPLDDQTFLCTLLAPLNAFYPEGVHGSRGSGSGRAVYDDPCVGVERLVLSESAAVAQAETK
jgi:hypothetical protein